MQQPNIKAFFDPATYTVTYVVSDPNSQKCAIIDSVLDFDQYSGRTSTESADKVIAYVQSEKLQTEWIIETHAHADHLSASPYLKTVLGGQVLIGEHIKDVQSIFKGVFNLEEDFCVDGSQFGRLVKDGDTLELGDLSIRAMHTPGHTPACISFVIGDSVFVGDTMFMPDFGTARCDFPGGDAATLFQSIQKLLTLPDSTKVFVGHDYKAQGRDFYAWESTIGEQKAKNIHVKTGISEAEFVNYRTTRDATLSLPQLILPSVQVNIRAGELPPKESNGVSYLKLPLNAL